MDEIIYLSVKLQLLIIAQIRDEGNLTDIAHSDPSMICTSQQTSYQKN